MLIEESDIRRFSDENPTSSTGVSPRSGGCASLSGTIELESVNIRSAVHVHRCTKSGNAPGGHRETIEQEGSLSRRGRVAPSLSFLGPLQY